MVASPTFKASYTGLLTLAPEVHLRPVLVELGAVTPTRALYVLESQRRTSSGAVQRAIAA